MSTAAESSRTTTRRKITRRYWQRTDTPRSWWPWGLIPLLGLVALFLFGALVTAPTIQAEVRTRVADRFAGVGVMTTDVRSDGQGVSIRAEAQARDEIYLHALAKSTQCDTWAGQLTCPTAVRVSLNELQVPVAAPAAKELDTIKQPESTMSGSVVHATDAPAANDYQRCNDVFEKILTTTAVRFRTGSAVIDSSNADLLERLAQVARTCPGDLAIEGHTDSQGDAFSNRALSLARAQAVRDALARLGIQADRVRATGFGESVPIADNGTPDGRARNRRIEITISEVN